MSNITSSTYRVVLKRLARARIVFVVSCCLIVSGVVTCIALTPALLSVAVPFMSIVKNESTAEKDHAAIYEENKKQATRVRVLMSALEPFVHIQENLPHEIIERIYALRPEGVLIERLEYQSTPIRQIHIMGTSRAREPVNDFRTILQREKLFESVSVPVAALVGALDGRFTMTLTLKQL